MAARLFYADLDLIAFSLSRAITTRCYSESQSRCISELLDAFDWMFQTVQLSTGPQEMLALFPIQTLLQLSHLHKFIVLKLTLLCKE